MRVYYVKKKRRKIRNKWEGMIALLEEVFSFCDWFGNPIKPKKIKKEIKNILTNNKKI